MPSTSTNAVARTLGSILDNQIVRAHAALEDLPADVFTREAGGDCHSIRDIGRHLITLQRFDLVLLGSPLAERIIDPETVETVDQLREALDNGARLVRQAIEAHDPDDWFATPDPPREGKWGELPTIERFIKPFNDFTNHLGGIRALRRQFGCGAERTQ